MRHFDGVDTGIVQGLGDRADAVSAIHVKDGMHPVTQGDILDVKLAGFRVESHAATLSRFCSAIRSPAALAAAVIMSRLPEYFGR